MMMMIVVMAMVIMMMMCCRCYSRKSAVFSLPDLFLFQHFHLLFPRPLGVGKIRLVEKTGRGRCSRRWTGPCGRRGVSTHSSCSDKTSERAFHRRRPSRNWIARRCYSWPLHFMVSWKYKHHHDFLCVMYDIVNMFFPCHSCFGKEDSCKHI